MFVVGDVQDRAGPARAVTQCAHNLRHVELSVPYVVWRMFIGCSVSHTKELRIEKYDLGQIATLNIGKELRDRREMRRRWDAEAACLRQIGEVVRPGDASLVEQIENRTRDRLIQIG